MHLITTLVLGGHWQAPACGARSAASAVWCPLCRTPAESPRRVLLAAWLSWLWGEPCGCGVAPLPGSMRSQRMVLGDGRSSSPWLLAYRVSPRLVLTPIPVTSSCNCRVRESVRVPTGAVASLPLTGTPRGHWKLCTSVRWRHWGG